MIERAIERVRGAARAEVVNHLRPGIVCKYGKTTTESLLNIQPQGVVMRVIVGRKQSDRSEVWITPPLLSVGLGRNSGYVQSRIHLPETERSACQVRPLVSGVGNAGYPIAGE